MPALAHIGVGLAAKKSAPTINVWILILAAEAVEIVFMILWALGIEHPPTSEISGFAPYSHSIVSGLLISLLAGILYYAATRKRKQSILIFSLALSHTVMDVLASPMLGFYPTDTGKTFFFNDGLSIGLGLYSNPRVRLIAEYGITAIGLGLYLHTKIINRKTSKNSKT